MPTDRTHRTHTKAGRNNLLYPNMADSSLRGLVISATLSAGLATTAFAWNIADVDRSSEKVITVGGAQLPAADTSTAPTSPTTTGERTPLIEQAALSTVTGLPISTTSDAHAWPTPERAASALPEENVVQERIVVRRGDTLMDILLRSGIARAEAHEAVTSLSSMYDPRKLRVGQHMDLELERATRNPDGTKLAALSLNLDFESDLRVVRDPAGGFEVEKSERRLVRQTHAASSVIDDSLYITARKKGVDDEALMQLIRLFSWDVDFQHDVHAGDSFAIVYDVLGTEDGEHMRVEKLRYAGLTLRGSLIEAYRFEHADGTVGYYDAEGRSMRKWLMRTPIDGARLSSGFGKRRHPILGYTKMHKGVDFAAPRGTPIFAAGDGVVVEAGRKGAYGNYVRIRHNAEYSTAYAHLKGFSSKIRAGERVGQGQVIGYVGSTGRSTGPHLHYEVLERGRQINPLKVKKQVTAKLEGSELAAFRRRVEEVVALRLQGTRERHELALR